MSFRSIRIGLAFTLLAVLASPLAHAEPIVAGTTDLTGTAIMDLTLLPGPFNPTPDPILLPGVSGFGTITIDRAAQTGNIIPISSLSGGLFYGTYNFPVLGPMSYVFGNIAPLTGADFSGQITNVVQNPADPGFGTGQPSSFQSGDFSFGGASFGFEFLSAPLAGLKLFTDPAVPFSFTASFDGLPPSQGTILLNSGTDILNVYILGDPNLTPVATSSNRIIVLSVPEPSSVVMLGLGTLGLVGAVRLRRRTA